MSSAHVIPEPDPRGLRNFGLTSGLMVAVLFGLLLPWLMQRSMPVWPWILSGILVSWALLAAPTLRPVYRWWMRFGILMSRVTIPVFMFAVFFLVVTPLGAVWRSVSRNSLARHCDPSLESYRSSSERRKSEDMRRPF